MIEVEDQDSTPERFMYQFQVTLIAIGLPDAQLLPTIF